MSAELQATLDRGLKALNLGDFQSAAQACQSALKADPNLVPAHFLVGLVAMEAKERQTAHEAFKSVVKLDRNHAAAWAQLARLNVSEGRIALAEAALKETRRIKPQDPPVLDTIGGVLSQLGEYHAAKAFFARVNALAPRQPHYMMNLANTPVFLCPI